MRKGGGVFKVSVDAGLKRHLAVDRTDASIPKYPLDMTRMAENVKKASDGNGSREEKMKWRDIISGILRICRAHTRVEESIYSMGI